MIGGEACRIEGLPRLWLPRCAESNALALNGMTELCFNLIFFLVDDVRESRNFTL